MWSGIYLAGNIVADCERTGVILIFKVFGFRRGGEFKHVFCVKEETLRKYE